MENEFINNHFHKPNGPFWHAGDDWGWMLYGKWHRYYGPQSNTGTWYIRGDRIKIDFNLQTVYNT